MTDCMHLDEFTLSVQMDNYLELINLRCKNETLMFLEPVPYIHMLYLFLSLSE